MAIVFHCEHCGKKIDAPLTAGGKWGKCPACHNRIYVPLVEPAAPADELRLAPIDDGDEERRNRLLTETFQLTQDILQEKGVPESSSDETPAPKEEALFIPMVPVEDKDLTKDVVQYLRLMADGELDKASQVIGMITPYRKQALAILDRIALGEILDPRLAAIPPHVLSGLIRNLRSEL
jgi:hypothetical protein